MNAKDQVRVLIVDDSATARHALRLGLEADDRITIVGEVARGDKVLETVRHLRPDIVTMDVFLAGCNGLDVAAELMTEAALPIVVVTAANPTEPGLVYRAMAAGVLEVRAKLPPPTSSSYEQRRRELARVVRALASVPVVTRRVSTRPSAPAPRARSSHPACVAAKPSESPSQRRRMLVLGASTGGPKLLCDILCALPRRLEVATVIAQHITRGFGAGLADWFSSESGREVVQVKRPIRAEPGTVYLPAEGRHLEVRGDGILVPSDHSARTYVPCIDVLFESAARHVGERAIGVLLTGMGRDGAQGLLALHRAGALTVAQQPRTCTVDSMPAAAIECGAAQFVLAPPRIIEVLSAHCVVRAA